MALYFKIKKSDVTQNQINFSTSKNIESARVIIDKGIIWNTEFLILKTEDNIFSKCNYFDSCIPYSIEEITKIIKEAEK